MKHYRKFFKLKPKMWHESRSFRRTDYTPFPQQDFNQGFHTKTGGNKHNTAPPPPANLFMTHIYRCFQNVLMKRASPRELHTLKKSFITILRSSDNCYFSKQSSSRVSAWGYHFRDDDSTGKELCTQFFFIQNFNAEATHWNFWNYFAYFSLS